MEKKEVVVGGTKIVPLSEESADALDAMITNYALGAIENGVPEHGILKIMEVHEARRNEGKTGFCEGCGSSIPLAVLEKNPLSVSCSEQCSLNMLLESNKVFEFEGRIYRPPKRNIIATITESNEMLRGHYNYLKGFLRREVTIVGIENVVSPSAVSRESMVVFSLNDGQERRALKVGMFQETSKLVANLQAAFPLKPLIFVC